MIESYDPYTMSRYEESGPTATKNKECRVRIILILSKSVKFGTINNF